MTDDWDLEIFNMIIDCIENGYINIFDTAINWRYQNSEWILGRAMWYLKDYCSFNRNEIII